MRFTAIYARQSVEKVDSLSIDTQIDFCKSILSTDNIEYYKDSGFSGKNTERPALKELIKDIENGQVEKVIVYKLDRISRNISDFYKLYELMEKHKCSFCSASETFDTSNPMGKAMMGILAIFAQMERENIQKRVKDNYYYRIAETGSWAGGPAPYGYKNGKNDKKKPTLIPVQEELEVVERIFALYSGVAHLSLSKIARDLTSLGYRRKTGAAFDSSSISKILQNPIYAVADETLYSYFKTRKIQFLNDKDKWNGKHSANVVGKRQGNANIRSYATLEEQSIYITNIKGFIPSILYIQVQERLAENKQLERGDGGLLEELSGKLKCSKCHYSVRPYSQSDNGNIYLGCYANRVLHICDQTFHKFSYWELQENVGKQIQIQLDNMHKHWSEKQSIVQEYEKKIEALQIKIEKIVSAFGDDEVAQKATVSTVRKMQDELDQLELQRNVARRSAGLLNTYINCNVIIDDAISAGLKYEDLTPTQKREVVNTLISKIYLTDKTDTFEIEWKF